MPYQSAWPKIGTDTPPNWMIRMKSVHNSWKQLQLINKAGLKSFWHSGHARLRRFLLSEEWAIGVVKAPIQSFLDDSFVPMVTWIGKPCRNSFIADCFGVVDGEERFILVERFTYNGSSRIRSNGKGERRIGRGHIASIAVDTEGSFLKEVTAIDNGLHMSYPFTIHDRGSWYIVAEELSANSLNLYRRSSGGDWKHLKQLLPHAVIDPAVFNHAGRWWMFGTSAGNPCSELLIWYADQLEGDWHPHCKNPVRIDQRNARSGGTPFLVGDHLYRPAQNCCETYGGSVIINQIDELTSNSFSEHAVQEVLPPANSAYRGGIHTLSALEDWTLIDAKRHVIIPQVILRRLIARLS
jgi:hypothetical protein